MDICETTWKWKFRERLVQGLFWCFCHEPSRKQWNELYCYKIPVGKAMLIVILIFTIYVSCNMPWYTVYPNKCILELLLRVQQKKFSDMACLLLKSPSYIFQFKEVDPSGGLFTVYTEAAVMRWFRKNL